MNFFQVDDLGISFGGIRALQGLDLEVGPKDVVFIHVTLVPFLKAAGERRASDLHLKVGSHPVVRVDGRLLPLTEQKRLMQEDTIGMAFSIMGARQKQKFKENLEIDIAYSVPGLGRFRCNVFQQRGTVGLVLRVIPVKVLNFADLLLPPVVECSRETAGPCLKLINDGMHRVYSARAAGRRRGARFFPSFYAWPLRVLAR